MKTTLKLFIETAGAIDLEIEGICGPNNLKKLFWGISK
tara:strand:+ start:395 stop:508 length:114 start_codon:yes stop_codon:yes gene_type:complete